MEPRQYPHHVWISQRMYRSPPLRILMTNEFTTCAPATSRTALLASMKRPMPQTDTEPG